MIKSVLHKVTRFHNRGSLPNVAIFSSARSGSSWLMELIASQPGFKFVDEPLHPENLCRAGLTDSTGEEAWGSLLPNPERKERLQGYIENIEKNRIHIGEPRLFSKFYRMFTNRIVYKFLRCKDLIPWFQSEFGFQVIYLVRHPLACSVSRQHFPRLKLFLANSEYMESYLTADQIQLAKQVSERGDQWQSAILDWCIQNKPAMDQAKSGTIEIMYYEHLVHAPDSQIDQLTNRLSLSDKKLMLDSLNEASASTVQSDQSTQDAFASEKANPSKSFLLGKWRQKITPEQELEAFEILNTFEVDLYQVGNDLPC